jgi:hypothetical protein
MNISFTPDLDAQQVRHVTIAMSIANMVMPDIANNHVTKMSLDTCFTPSWLSGHQSEHGIVRSWIHTAVHLGISLSVDVDAIEISQFRIPVASRAECTRFYVV